jgi:lipopolysaccharide transport system ATP-binding protein
MIYGIQDIARNICGLAANSERIRKGEFWAVNDISFELKKGESLGIIGPNGAGKTTLLSMLNGIFMPDKGKITIKGKTGALIALGAGFHPMLTGRENIFINGAIMGMSKEEINDKFDSIVKFADIGDFLDMPVKNYSSGMYVRLGFAVAIHSEPDILLVDEVLSVDDVAFRSKCYSKIDELKSKNVTFVMVGHSPEAISRVCKKAMLLIDGKIQSLGDLTEVYNKYSKQIRKTSRDPEFLEREDLKFVDFNLFNSNGENVSEIRYNESITLEFTLWSRDSDRKIVFEVFIMNNQYLRCARFISSRDGFYSTTKEGIFKIRLKLKDLKLVPGFYTIRFEVFSASNIATLVVVGNAGDFTIQHEKMLPGIYHPKHSWEDDQ